HDIAAARDNHGHGTANELGRKHRQPVILIVGPAIFDCHVLALDEAGFVQALTEGRDMSDQRTGRHAAEKTDHRHRLLRARRERPRRRRAADERDELAAFHSITSSARASSVGGTSMLRAFAVLRLITSSYLVGFCTGRSAGFSPFRMRSTYPAARR